MSYDMTLRSTDGVVCLHGITKRKPAPVCAMPAHVIDWPEHEKGVASMDALIAERRLDAVGRTGKPFAEVPEQERGEE